MSFLMLTRLICDFQTRPEANKYWDWWWSSKGR